MDKSSSWQANCHSARQEILRLLRNPFTESVTSQYPVSRDSQPRLTNQFPQEHQTC
jgi:hypothetical protein